MKYIKSNQMIGSRANDWMRGTGNADRVYGYDAWTAPLVAPG